MRLTLRSLERARISVGRDGLKTKVRMIPERRGRRFGLNYLPLSNIFRILGELDSNHTCSSLKTYSHFNFQLFPDELLSAIIGITERPGPSPMTKPWAASKFEKLQLQAPQESKVQRREAEQLRNGRGNPNCLTEIFNYTVPSSLGKRAIKEHILSVR